MATITETEAGASGRYIHFDESLLNDAIQTVLVYCKPTGSPENGLGYLFAKGDSSGHGPRFIISHNSGSPFLALGMDSSGTPLSPTVNSQANSVVYNSWGHYAFTRVLASVNYSDLNIYAGVGVDLAATTPTGPNNGSGSINSDAAYPAYLMNRNGLSRAFVGDLAYVAAWSGILTLPQLVNAQNNGPLSQATGLLFVLANEIDNSSNALAVSGRSTFVAGGSLPPNTALGGTTPSTLPGRETLTLQAVSRGSFF